MILLGILLCALVSVACLWWSTVLLMNASPYAFIFQLALAILGGWKTWGRDSGDWLKVTAVFATSSVLFHAVSYLRSRRLAATFMAAVALGSYFTLNALF